MKIVFISRQSDEPTLDFRLLAENFRRQDSSIQIDFFCKKAVTEKVGLGYGGEMLRQMKSLRTADICILDSYAPVVSLLPRSILGKRLKVVQLWHASGLMKKAGWASVGSGEGRSRRVAKLLRMHRGYDYFLSSSPAAVSGLAAVFGQPESKAIISPLPRFDVLRDENWHRQNRQKIFALHPELEKSYAQGRNILYAPTTRKDSELLKKQAAALDEACRKVDYKLLLAPHPNTAADTDPLPGFGTLELFSVASAVVTDYSSLVFEAMAASVPTYFFAFDLADYDVARGFFIDYQKEIPGRICRAAEEVVEQVVAKTADSSAQQQFLQKYVELPPAGQNAETVTTKLARKIRSL